MRIGVVVPTYNRQRLVLETLESVLAQTRAADHVVIVDDGSRDETVARLRDWVGNHEQAARWEVVPLARNRGVSAARNAGLARLDDCDLVGFLDSDDIWPPEMLERIEGAARARPDAMAYVVDRLNEDFTREREPWMQRFDWIEDSPVERLIRLGCPGPSCVVMRRAALAASGGWDEELCYMEDFDVMARLALAGPIAHVPGVAVHYRLGIGAEHGEQRALSQSLSDRGLHRARAVERFRSAHAYPGLTRERAFCWYRAGRSAYRQRNWIECQQRCVRSLRIAPWYPRPAVLWLLARVRRFFAPGATPT